MMGSHTHARKRVHHQVSAAAASSGSESSIAPSLPLNVPLNVPASSILIGGPPHELVSGGRPLHLREMPGDRDQRQVTIDILPDDVLLEIFNVYTDTNTRGWPTLVHVCRRWRSVVFASTHRLNLRLRCTYKTPVRETLDVWPALPIIIRGRGGRVSAKGADNVVAALEHPDRVRRIHLTSIPNSVFKRFSAAMEDPFPALTDLWLVADTTMVPVLPDSFLGGSAPRLKLLWLLGVSFPTLPKLLLSSNDLVELCLWNIPHSGYISPEAMVAGLSALTRLKMLKIKFLSPPSRPGQPSPPRSTRTVLPALNSFDFGGVSEYLEDLTSRIDAPLLSGLHIKFIYQPIFNTPRLCLFISRAEKLRLQSRACIELNSGFINIYLTEADCSCLSLWILCRASDRHLPSLTQVCNSPFLSLFNLEHLKICECWSIRPQWQANVENTHWLELLRRFTTVKSLSLSEEVTPYVVPALQDLSGEGIMDVLPALQSIFLPESLLSGTVEQALTQFLTARQLSGHPVAVNPPGQE